VKTRLVCYAMVTLSLAGLWFFLLFTPLHKEQTNLVFKTKEAQQQLTDFITIMNELPGFLKARQDLETERSMLNSRLYAKNDLLKLFQKLCQQAQEKNLVITEISPPIDELLYLNSIVPDSNQAQLLSISLKLEGRYIDFGRFVGTVEQSEYFRGINSCKIMVTKTGDGDIRFEFGLNTLLGSFKEKA
jgi:Tfp pilus assembly protein PilO